MLIQKPVILLLNKVENLETFDSVVEIKQKEIKNEQYADMNLTFSKRPKRPMVLLIA